MNEPVFYKTMRYKCQNDECALELTFMLEDGCEGPRETMRVADARMLANYPEIEATTRIPHTNSGRVVLPVPFVASLCPKCCKGFLQHTAYYADALLHPVVVGVPDQPHFRYPDDPYAHHACGHPVLAGLPDYEKPTDIDTVTPDLRCQACGNTENKIAMGLAVITACPECGSENPPVLIAEDVTLTLNWLDLRCLVQWSAQYIDSIPEKQETTQYWEGLKKRINAHRPEGSAPLSFLEEIEELREAGHDVTLVEPDPPESGDD